MLSAPAASPQPRCHRRRADGRHRRGSIGAGQPRVGARCHSQNKKGSQTCGELMGAWRTCSVPCSPEASDDG